MLFFASLIATDFTDRVGTKLEDWVNDDIRALLVMTGSSVPTEEDAVTIGDFTSLTEFDGAVYTPGGITVPTKTTSKDNVNNRTDYLAGQLDYGNLGAGAGSVIGVVVYRFVTDVPSSLWLAYNELSSPKAADGNQFLVDFAGGIVYRGSAV